MQYAAVQKDGFPAGAVPLPESCHLVACLGLTDLGHFRHSPNASWLTPPLHFGQTPLRAQVKVTSSRCAPGEKCSGRAHPSYKLGPDSVSLKFPKSRYSYREWTVLDQTHRQSPGPRFGVGVATWARGCRLPAIRQVPPFPPPRPAVRPCRVHGWKLRRCRQAECCSTIAPAS
jgi:hypothetical protein